MEWSLDYDSKLVSHFRFLENDIFKKKLKILYANYDAFIYSESSRITNVTIPGKFR